MKKLLVAYALSGAAFICAASVNSEVDTAIAHLVRECKSKFKSDTLHAMRQTLHDGKKLIRHILPLQKRGMGMEELMSDKKGISLLQEFWESVDDVRGKMLADLNINNDVIQKNPDLVMHKLAFFTDALNHISMSLDSDEMDDVQRNESLLVLIECMLKHLSV